MTNEKPKKKSRLRNAEYYDMQEVLDGLYEDSQKGCTFQSLIPLIVCEENIKLAYRNIKRNSGSKTAGTDGATIKDLEKWKTENLIKHIQEIQLLSTAIRTQGRNTESKRKNATAWNTYHNGQVNTAMYISSLRTDNGSKIPRTEQWL